MSDRDDNLPSVGRISQHDHAKLRRAWLQSPAVWRFVPGRGNRKHIRRWLGGQSRDDWHEIALNFDMDTTDLAPLHFIVSQPNCDRASVLTLLLSLDPTAQEARHAKDPFNDPHSVAPERARLMDKIAEGFAQGFYPEGQFRIRQTQGRLRQAAHEYSMLENPTLWSFPDRAWLPTKGQRHRPDYVWDRAESCQRIPFEIWVRARLRPN